jgi:hypothetical protein
MTTQQQLLVRSARVILQQQQQKTKRMATHAAKEAHMRHDPTAMGYLTQASISRFSPFLHRASMIVAVPTQ